MNSVAAQPSLCQADVVTSAVELLHSAALQLDVSADDVTVLTSRAGRVVGRVVLPDGRDVVVKISAESGDFTAEASAVEDLRKAGLPVSRERFLSSGPPSVIALDWTVGRPVTAGDDEDVRRQVVDLLKRVHTLPARAPYGGVNPDLVAWIDGWCDHALGWWGGGAGSWYRRVRPLIEGRAGSAILLDGVPDHFIVGPDARVRLIDVANLQAGDPVMDLAVLHLHSPELLNDVLEDYDHPEVSQEHLAELLPFYVFLRALAAAEWHADVLHDEPGRDAWLRRAQTALSRSA